MPDILIISDDVVGEKMAGPGIRAWEIARSLAGALETVLAIPDYSPGDAGRLAGGSGFEVIRYSAARPSSLRKAAERSRIVLIQKFLAVAAVALLVLQGAQGLLQLAHQAQAAPGDGQGLAAAGVGVTPAICEVG